MINLKHNFLEEVILTNNRAVIFHNLDHAPLVLTTCQEKISVVSLFLVFFLLQAFKIPRVIVLTFYYLKKLPIVMSVSLKTYEKM